MPVIHATLCRELCSAEYECRVKGSKQRERRRQCSVTYLSRLTRKTDLVCVGDPLLPPVAAEARRRFREAGRYRLLPLLPLIPLQAKTIIPDINRAGRGRAERSRWAAGQDDGPPNQSQPQTQVLKLALDGTPCKPFASS